MPQISDGIFPAAPDFMKLLIADQRIGDSPKARSIVWRYAINSSWC
jgi:hypothetical protein